MKTIKPFLESAILFLGFGVAAVMLRKIDGFATSGVLNGLGAVAWAGLLTSIISYIFHRNKYWTLISIILSLVISFSVELFQLTKYPREWAQQFPISRLFFGSSFDAGDLLWYAVGVLMAWIFIISRIEKDREMH
ncbi:MAG: DUF2809 domain-containing protein [Rothia sp. (in: high G+C Gram-positive bacteria)]|nr:DUF2809 domain-containing protein [Rothia sp. (in: high G+C Gram-positive bacteria)]